MRKFFKVVGFIMLVLLVNAVIIAAGIAAIIAARIFLPSWISVGVMIGLSATILGIWGLVERRRGEDRIFSTGLLLGSIGGWLNFIVIALNNWKMPVAVVGESMQQGLFPKIYFSSVENPDARLLFLSDWINVGNGMASPGDFFAAAAILMLLISWVRNVVSIIIDIIRS